MAQFRPVLLTLAVALVGLTVLAPVLARHPVAMAHEPGRRHGTFVWSNGSERIELSQEGDVEFTDDDADVKSIVPGGYFSISDGGWFGGRGVDMRADASGRITRRYRVGIVEKPYEPDGRLWLTRTLPRFIRQSGFGARARVARTLKASGPEGVLADISRIDGSYGKRVYFTELLRTGALDGAMLSRAVAQASREITSGYELRQTYSAVLNNSAPAPDVLASLLSGASSIRSDYELASLLTEIARRQPLDTEPRRAFFTALEGVRSAYDHGRVLAALSERADLSPELLVGMLQSATRMQSDYERAQFLVRIAKARAIDETTRPAFFAAVDAIDSAYEKRRVLDAVARRSDTPPDTLVSLLRSAARIEENYDRSQVLLTVAGNHPVAGAARDAYLQAAEHLDDFERRRALSALVQNEGLGK